MKLDSVGVVGGGAWGTALAQVLRLAGREVVLWAREPEVVAGINDRHVNGAFLPDIPLDARLTATSCLADPASCDALFLATPAQHVRATARELAAHARRGQPLAICAKGLEQSSGKLMGEVVGEELPEVTRAVLSGPSFAADVARGLPTAVTLACAGEELGRLLAERLGCRQFRVYWTDDMRGVEIGGAVKNVLAIAAGIVAGKGLGASAHAALVTRGFAEMCRLGTALGARPETLMGLSGLGDLVLTCGDPKSRNMSLGRALGEGRSLDDVLSTRRSVTEGVTTAAAVVRLARETGTDMPIVEAVHAIVEGRVSVEAAITGLLARPFRAEG